MGSIYRTQRLSFGALGLFTAVIVFNVIAIAGFFKGQNEEAVRGAKGLGVLPLLPNLRQFFHFHKNLSSSVIPGTFFRENRFPPKPKKRPKIPRASLTALEPEENHGSLGQSHKMCRSYENISAPSIKESWYVLVSFSSQYWYPKNGMHSKHLCRNSWWCWEDLDAWKLPYWI